jgi:hypothetical protein
MKDRNTQLPFSHAKDHPGVLKVQYAMNSYNKRFFDSLKVELEKAKPGLKVEGEAYKLSTN